MNEFSKQKLYELDEVLEVLEKEMLKGNRIVTKELAENISPIVPTIIEGQKITKAFKEVYSFQIIYMKD